MPTHDPEPQPDAPSDAQPDTPPGVQSEAPASSVPPKKKLGGEVALLIAAGVAEQVAAIGLMVMLSRLLSFAEYGTFRQLWMTQRTLVVLFMVGLPISLQYYLPKVAPAFRPGLAHRSMLLLGVSGMVAAVGTFVFADPIAELFNNPDLAPLLRIFSVYPMLVLPTHALRAAMIEVGLAVRFALFTLIDQSVTLVAGVAIVWATGQLEPLVWLLVVLGVAKLLGAVVLNVATMRSKIDHTDTNGRRIGVFKQMKFALGMSLMTAIDSINTQLDKFMVASFFSVEQFAKYANGAFHVPVVSTVVAGFSAALLPEYVRRADRGAIRGQGGVIELWHDSVRQTACLFIPMVVFLVVFGEAFVTLMFSEAYAGAALIFQVYVLSLLPRMTWFGYVLIALGKPKEPVIGTVIALITNAGFNLAGIYTLGLLGPAVGTVLSVTVVAAYYLMRIRKEAELTWPTVLPWGALAKLMGLSLAVVVLVAPIAWVDVWFGWPAWLTGDNATAEALATLLAAGLIYAAVGVVGLRVTGLIRPDEWDAALAKLPGPLRRALGAKRV